MKSATASVFLSAAFFAGLANAQVEIFPKPWANPALWSADTLWVGASFTRTSSHPVTVTLKGNSAGWAGDLFFIDPASGAEDRLFSNHDPVGTTVTLSDRHDIALGDTLYFVYRVTEPVSGTYPSANSRLPKYTGPNIPGQSRYVAEATNPDYGHRWSVAGRANDSIVEFGFEDDVEPTSSDYDFDDIVFRTTLSLLGSEVPARLFFTDKDGNPLPADAYYSPANDTLYLRYTDDYVQGDIRKEVTVRIRNRRGAAGPDSESVSVLPLRREGDAGVWSVKLPLQEAAGIPADGKAQVYILGEITAGVASHDRLGRPDGGMASAVLKAAYPDQPESVRLRACADPAAAIDGTTACLKVEVSDQSFSRGADTVWAEVRCGKSGDRIARVPVFETAAGTYVSGDIAKNDGAVDPADQAVSCLSSDTVTATYADEVYGKQVSARAGWDGAIATGAYIKDADGDGRADRLYMVFGRSLAGLPGPIKPIYWNQALDDADHAFSGAPKSMGIDPARPNVLAIDLSNAPFPKGFTGIPAGAAAPYAVVPAGQGYAGGKPLIADSVGPILVAAEIRPFLGTSASGADALNADTLRVTVSEPLAARADWMSLLRVGTADKGQCHAYDKSAPLIPAREPEAAPGGLAFTFLVGDGMALRPLAGDCAYLNVDGSYTDLPGNLPPIHGEILGGKLPPRKIDVLEGYPPVAGLDPSLSGSAVPRYQGAGAGGGAPQWIPPADWPAGYVPGSSVYVPEAHAPGDPVHPGADGGAAEPMPGGIGAVQVVSTGEYIAQVSIFDNLGNWVCDFSQSFGYRGELANARRRAASGRGLVSYLVWNLKDSRGRMAGNGAYVWKIRFLFADGKQEIRYVRTGLMRNIPG